jgi:hypothetical protein
MAMLTCGTCGHRGDDGTTYRHDCYWVFRDRAESARAHRAYADARRDPNDDVAIAHRAKAERLESGAGAVSEGK